MKLDFGVLEEVRRELETWHDIYSRPVLTRIRKLTREQLHALSILCACNARATIDQLWALHYSFEGEGGWTKEALVSHLEAFRNAGIIEISDGAIRFGGDDFDKIYAKYYAREQDVVLNLSRRSPDQQWLSSLEDFFDNVVPERLKLLTPRYPINGRPIEVISLAERLSQSHSDDDPLVDADYFAEELYKVMVEHRGKAKIIVLKVSVSLLGLRASSLYVAVDPDDESAVKDGLLALQPVRARLADVGGEVTVEEVELPVADVEVMARKVEGSANEQSRFMLAMYHMETLHEAYVNRQDPEDAQFHADWCYGINLN